MTSPTDLLIPQILASRELRIAQRKELAELFGFETRNKYEIRSESNQPIGFCAEQGRGPWGFLWRQLLGHWRSFEIHFYDSNRQLQFVARHPFRWFFQRLDLNSASGHHLGTIRQRFGVLSKRFDIYAPDGRVLFEMRSGLFSFWTFPIKREGQMVARVSKRWSGILKEVFLDADNFRIEFRDSHLQSDERLLILAAGMFVDLQYFERKAR